MDPDTINSPVVLGGLHLQKRISLSLCRSWHHLTLLASTVTIALFSLTLTLLMLLFLISGFEPVLLSSLRVKLE
jgi:hypothetical protein